MSSVTSMSVTRLLLVVVLATMAGMVVGMNRTEFNEFNEDFTKSTECLQRLSLLWCLVQRLSGEFLGIIFVLVGRLFLGLYVCVHTFFEYLGTGCDFFLVNVLDLATPQPYERVDAITRTQRQLWNYMFDQGTCKRIHYYAHVYSIFGRETWDEVKEDLVKFAPELAPIVLVRTLAVFFSLLVACTCLIKIFRPRQAVVAVPVEVAPPAAVAAAAPAIAPAVAAAAPAVPALAAAPASSAGYSIECVIWMFITGVISMLIIILPFAVHHFMKHMKVYLALYDIYTRVYYPLSYADFAVISARKDQSCDDFFRQIACIGASVVVVAAVWIAVFVRAVLFVNQ